MPKNTPAIMDILDGYHRYIAISQVVREYPEWDYQMELRITTFTEEKAKQFIYQNDQKTQMRRINSESMNQYSPSNIVVEKLNTNPGSNIRGQINRNNGNIDFSFLSAVIHAYYFNDRSKKYSMKEIITVANDLQKKWNSLTTEDMNWLEHQYTEKEVQVIIFCFANDVYDAATIRAMMDKADTIDPTLFKLGQKTSVRKKLVDALTTRLAGG